MFSKEKCRTSKAAWRVSRRRTSSSSDCSRKAGAGPPCHRVRHPERRRPPARQRRAGRGRHLPEPDRRPRPPAGPGPFPRTHRRGRCLRGGVPDSQLSPESVRRGRPQRLLHSGLCPPRSPGAAPGVAPGGGRGGRAPGARRGRPGGAGRDDDTLAGVRAGAGLHRGQARAGHPAGPHPLPGRRAPGADRLVHGGPQQPPQVLPVLRHAGDLERGDHRGDAGPGAGSRPGDAGALGGGGRRVRGGGAASETLVLWAAWGSVAGSVLQLSVQLPTVWRLTGGIPLTIGRGDANVRTVLGNFLPAFVSRGAVQISAFVDAILASLLPTAAVAAAQTLYTLPVSLFGMSVAAAELPELSADAATSDDAYSALRERLERGMRQVAYFIVPSAVALAALGQVIAGAMFQTGVFTRADSFYVWGILAGSAVGLLASTLGRLYSSAWYALHDARTPLRYALIRVGLTIGLGYFAAIHLPGLLGMAPAWGAAGLTASAGVAGWVEFLLLRRGLDRRIGVTRLPAGLVARLWAPALGAAAAGWGVLGWLDGRLGPIPTAVLVLAPLDRKSTRLNS